MHGLYPNLFHYPRLSLAQYSFTVSHCSLKHHFILISQVTLAVPVMLLVLCALLDKNVLILPTQQTVQAGSTVWEEW